MKKTIFITILFYATCVCAVSWREIAKENDMMAGQEKIDAGADVNQKLEQGMTPLLWTTFYGSADVVRCLLEHGACKNDMNNVRYQDGYWIRKGWEAIDIAMTDEPMQGYGYASILKKDFARRAIIQMLLAHDKELAQRTLEVLNFRDSLDKATYSFLKFCTGVSFATFPTTCNTYRLAVECIANDIPGDFVECGVARGAQIAVMGYACQQYQCEKKIHLFDSFQGIPLAGPNDASQPGIRGPIKHNVNVPLEQLLVSSGVDVFSVSYVKNNMKRWGVEPHRLVYHEGWFQNTLPTDADKIEQICVLRLDGDLYESTKVCLEYLYPKIVPGGYLIIDDYALPGCAKAIHEYREKHGITCPIIKIPQGRGPAYWRVS